MAKPHPIRRQTAGQAGSPAPAANRAMTATGFFRHSRANLRSSSGTNSAVPWQVASSDHYAELGADFGEEIERRAADAKLILDIALKYGVPVDMR